MNCNKSAYTLNEVCELFYVTCKTLYNWEKSGVLKSFKVGGVCRYNKEIIDEIINKDKKI